MASETKATVIQATAKAVEKNKTVFAILLAISFCHLLNDTVQSVIPAIYPMLKASFHLDFGQVGLIALTLQLTASLLQPLVGLHMDKHPRPYSLAVGMGITTVGLLALAMAPTYGAVLLAAGTVGMVRGISSRVIASGTNGLGWTTRLSAILVSSGRKCWLGPWSTTRGVCSDERAVEYRVVFICCAHRNRPAHAHRLLVEKNWHSQGCVAIERRRSWGRDFVSG